MAKIELPEGWAGVAEPLRAPGWPRSNASRTRTARPLLDLAVVSAQCARVSDAIRAMVRARIADAQAAQALAPKR